MPPLREIAAWMSRKPSGGRTAWRSTGMSTSRSNPMSASCKTNLGWRANSDQTTITQRAVSSRTPIWLRQLLPAGMR